eukprot:COSAG05_NODE_2459_length_3037_cov_3.928523_2_plen_453_part_00
MSVVEGAKERGEPEQLVILGAGSEACNGTYAQQGQSGGKPSYIHTGNPGLKVVWMAQYKAWSLSGGGKFYYKNTGPTLRDGGSVWQKSRDGTEAVPTHKWTQLAEPEPAPAHWFVLHALERGLVLRHYTEECGEMLQSLNVSDLSAIRPWAVPGDPPDAQCRGLEIVGGAEATYRLRVGPELASIPAGTDPATWLQPHSIDCAEWLRYLDPSQEPTETTAMVSLTLRDKRQQVSVAHSLECLEELQGVSLGAEVVNLSQGALKCPMGVLLPALSTMAGLRVLDVHDSKLMALPESLGELRQLQKLYLDGNQLTELPDSLAQLTQLVSLSLSNNKLTTLPWGIGNLTKLQGLYLKNNNLTTLPESVGELTQLVTLYCSNNKLRALPEGLGQLTQLHGLYVAMNRLEALPTSLMQLTNLNDFSLANNKLTDVDNDLTIKALEKVGCKVRRFIAD